MGKKKSLNNLFTPLQKIQFHKDENNKTLLILPPPPRP